MIKKIGKTALVGIIAISFSMSGCTQDMLKTGLEVLKAAGIEINLNKQKVDTAQGSAESKEVIKKGDIQKIQVDDKDILEDEYEVQDGKVIFKKLEEGEHVVIITIKGIKKPVRFPVVIKKSKDKMVMQSVIKYDNDEELQEIEGGYDEDANGEIDQGWFIQQGEEFYWKDKDEEKFKKYEFKENQQFDIDKPQIVEEFIYRPIICHKVLEDGTLVLPDGKKFTKDQYAKRPDGSLKLPDGFILYPCMPPPPPPQPMPVDCWKVLDDGTLVLPDGRKFTRDQYTKVEDGSVKLMTGEILKPCYPPPPQPSVAPPPPQPGVCWKIESDGTLVLPDGRKFTRDQYTKVEDGSVKLMTGEILKPCYPPPPQPSVVPPPPQPGVCWKIESDGTLVLPDGRKFTRDQYTKVEDGSVKLMTGEILKPCYPPPPQPSVVPPPPQPGVCWKIESDGTLITPDGRRFAANQYTKGSDGSVKLVTGEFYAPCPPQSSPSPTPSSPPPPPANCWQILADGTLVMPDGITKYTQDKYTRQNDGSVKLFDGKILFPCSAAGV